MNNTLSTLVVSLAAIALSVSSVFGQPQPVAGKLTPSAKALTQSLASGETGKFWLYLEAEAFDSSKVFLTEKARARRARVDPVNFLIGPGDYPIKQSVLEEIRNSGLEVRRVSKWLKAVSVEGDRTRLARATALSVVKRVDIMRTLVSSQPEDIEPIKPGSPVSKSTALDYGASLFQTNFVNAVKLHEADLTGAGVTIAMFDSGFDINHPAFHSTDIVDTYDFINDDVAVDEIECPTDIPRNHQTSHGTATLSAVGAYTQDTLIGIAYGASFLLAKTEITCFDNETQVEEDNWIAAAEWSDSLGADIINSSLGYATFTDFGSYTFDDLDGNTALITIAADLAAARNILIFNSAGNERNTFWGHIVLPSDGDSVIAVGAVQADSNLASFSSPGPTADGRIKPDITTLGVGVVVASHLGGYGTSGGTSFSSPLTAAGAALALEHDPTLTAEELRNLIKLTGDRVDNPDNDFGWGLFDATAAANIIAFDGPYDLRVDINQVATFTLTTSGRTDSIPALSLVNPPSGVTFADNGDGTGFLDIILTSDDSRVIDVVLSANVGYFVDTTVFNVSRVDPNNPSGPVLVGPNPFEQSTNIYIDSSAGNVLTISIFNSSGEIVWEKVNNFRGSADEISDLWDGRNQQGQVAAAGVYILVVNSDRQTFRVKMLKTN